MCIRFLLAFAVLSFFCVYINYLDQIFRDLLAVLRNTDGWNDPVSLYPAQTCSLHSPGIQHIWVQVISPRLGATHNLQCMEMAFLWTNQSLQTSFILNTDTDITNTDIIDLLFPHSNKCKIKTIVGIFATICYNTCYKNLHHHSGNVTEICRLLTTFNLKPL